MKNKNWFYAASILMSTIISAHENEPLPIGNFALPMSQQPSPLFSFGQNILDKNDMLGYINPTFLKGKKGKYLFVNELYALYGITDRASIFALINVPVIFRENNLTTSAIGDTVFQGEYAYINKATSTSQTQATIVGSLYLPSGLFEPSKQNINLPPHNPFAGFGSTSFFLGTTANHMTFDWYMFGSVGGFITTERHDSKVGNLVLYQAGLGRNLRHFNDKILLLLFEMDGTFAKKDKLLGSIDPNSGFNVIFFGPSLYYSTKRFIFQIGIQAPVFQKFNGIQAKNSYLLSVNFAWLLNHDDYDK